MRKLKISWIVDPNHFTISTNAAIPSKSLDFNGLALQNPFKERVIGAQQQDIQLSTGKHVTVKTGGKRYHKAAFTPRGPAPHRYPQADVDESKYPDGISWKTDFGVQPMGLSTEQLQSDQQVILCRNTDGKQVNNVAITPIVTRVQKALWGTASLTEKRDWDDLNDKEPLFNALTESTFPQSYIIQESRRKADLQSLLFDHTNEITWFRASRTRSWVILMTKYAK